MKKLLSVVVVFVMIVAMSVSVFADTVVPDDTVRNEVSGKWTTSGKNAAYANSMMTVVAVFGETISVDSIQYIDQTTADENGAYSFDEYLPKDVPENGEGVVYNVFIGGSSLSAPKAAGRILYEEEENNNITVEGTVEKVGTNTGAIVALLNDNGENAVDPVTADPITGAFSITAPAGTYTLKITKPGHTQYTYNKIDISKLDQGATYTLYAGDASGDDYIGIQDVITVIGNLKVKPSETPGTANYDVSDDDYIGIQDVIAVIGNLKSAGIVRNGENN